MTKIGRLLDFAALEFPKIPASSETAALDVLQRSTSRVLDGGLSLLLANRSIRAGSRRPVVQAERVRRFTIEVVDGHESIPVPASLGSEISVATMLSVLGLENRVVLRELGEFWYPLDLDDLIDLRERTQRYRIGTLTVLS